MPDHLIIFDTTLRDGEQSPGASMTAEEKMRIAKQLEATEGRRYRSGLSASSNGDFAAVHAIAKAIKNSTVCALARANENDVRRAGDAIKGAKSGRLHMFLASSPIHMKMKLRMTPEQVLAQAVKSIGWAREYTDNIEFSPEDAGRSEPDFLCKLVEASIAAGATTINIPDTVGYTMPWQFGELIKNLRERVPELGQGRMVGALPQRSGHGGGQLGRRGDEWRAPGRMHDQRPGRARRQRVAGRNRHGGQDTQGRLPCTTRIDTKQIVAASKLVSSITGFPVQPNKAIVGANAFSHESGIHQDGVLKHRETYEIMRAEDVGWGANKLVLGKLSGRNAFKNRLTELGIELGTEESVNHAFARFKELADKKREIFDEDLHALVSDEQVTPEREHYKLIALKVVSETGEIPHAKITMGAGETELTAQTRGDGPIDATFKAIEQLTHSGAKMLLYSVNAITTGTDAQGEVTVRLERDGRIVNGLGADTDILVASAKAYINALNKLHSKQERLNPQLAA